MGTRFIHKNGKIIPIHSEHGDHQGDSKGQEATAPKNPSPMNPEHHHPEVRKVKSVEEGMAGGGSFSVSEAAMPKDLLKHLKN